MRFEPDAWRKSSYSNSAGECVEVAWAATAVGLRDSKNVEPVIVVGRSAWAALRRSVTEA